MNSHQAATRKARIDLAWAIAFVGAVVLTVVDYWLDGKVNIFNFFTVCVLALSYAGQKVGEAWITLRYAKMVRRANARLRRLWEEPVR